jgi:hypothetical protein
MSIAVKISHVIIALILFLLFGVTSYYDRTLRANHTSDNANKK